MSNKMLNISEQQICRFSHNKLIKELVTRNLSTNGDIDTLKTRLIRNCKGNSRQTIRQSVEFLAVIDFEATCVAKPPIPPQPYIQEIIEFPIVLIDVAQQTIVEKFHSYCRPVHQSILSDYCKNLTGITQEQVNNAPLFVDVFANVEKWLNDRDLLTNSKRRCVFVTDSRSDFNKYLHMQCELAQIVYPKWAYQWINIKNTFTEFYWIESGRIRDMLDKLDLPFVGNLHSGLDDATNIARIVIELIKDGCVLEPNEFYEPSMMPPIRNTLLLTTQSNSSKMICLNCSQCHTDIQGSCIQRSGYQRQNSRSLSPRIPPKRSVASANIPSLLDLPLQSTSNRFSKHRSGSSHSQLHDTDNVMDYK